MGKPTGFLDYERQSNPWLPPEERLQSFAEFRRDLNEAERRRQGARCMNCGVPFCQSGMTLAGMATGCPLHNLIPEWNDEVYLGNDRHALDRLLKTNNFPEFTGRVCPALCEAACTCGLNGEAVTVHDNELFIIETGFANGDVKPRPPAVRTQKKVAVVGSGPAGLTVADQLNRRGHNVTVFERSDRVGGLLMYGIPNMKLDKSVVQRRVDLMTAEGVTFCTGVEVGKTRRAEELTAEFDAVVLCCGARQPRDLTVPGREAAGVHFAVNFLTANTKSLLDSGFTDRRFIDAKNKRVVIVGGGDTGNDCVGTVLRHGCKSVVQLEMMPKPPEERGENNPWPQFPRTLKTDYGQQEAAARFGHDPRVYETTVKSLQTDGKGRLKAVETVKVAMQGRTPVPVAGSEETLPADLLIIAAGFTGCEEALPTAFGLPLTPRRTLATTGGSATEKPGIFAAGDARRGQSLVVWAIAEGRGCAKEVDEYLMGYTNMMV